MSHFADDDTLEYIASLEQQLATCQAENLRLRDALDNLLVSLDPSEQGEVCTCDPDVGYRCRVCSWPNSVETQEGYAALSAPPGDQSALREVIARVLEDVLVSANPVSDWLRSGKWTL